MKIVGKNFIYLRLFLFFVFILSVFGLVNSVIAQTTIPTLTTGPTLTATKNCSQKAQGDANCDNKINEADYVIWKCEFLGNGTCTNPNSVKTASFNLDQNVDLKDFEIWRQNSETITNTPIPTPTTSAGQPTTIPTPTNTPVPTTTGVPTGTARPTPTPAFMPPLNSNSGKTCTEVCSTFGKVCEGTGTDPSATNDRMVTYGFNGVNKCVVITKDGAVGCTTLVEAKGNSCSDYDGLNHDPRAHPAHWTYCRCK